MRWAVAKPPPRLSRVIVTPCAPASPNSFAAVAMPISQAASAGCCEPTWKAMPGRRPSAAARNTRSRASAGAQPNFRPKGVAESGASSTMRIDTAEPGAHRPRWSTSPGASEVNSRTPRSNAKAMSRGFLIGLP